MRYRISQLKLNIDDDIKLIEKMILKKIKRRDLKISNLEIIKESIDARKKPDIKLVYTVDFDCEEKLNLDEAKPVSYEPVTAQLKEKIAKLDCEGKLGKRPVIAGFGPCGIFAALVLAEAGLKPIVVERGQAVDDRVKSVEKFWNEGVLDTESNVQFGEGGAGTFSDGKLTTGIKDPRIRKVLREFVDAGADDKILYKQKPHIGTDKLRDVVKNLRYKIEELGGNVFFDTKLDSVVIDGDKITAVDLVNKSGENQRIEVDELIIAIGHSARDTFQMLLDNGMSMEQKPFSIGVRVEHPQEIIDRAQYGNPELAKKLGAADYKLNHRCENGRGVYTFCMCPGGVVVNASSELETAVTNGMSYSGRDSDTANSALLVDVRPEDFASEHPLAGVEFQRKYEKLAYINGNGKNPETLFGDFKKNSQNPVRQSLPAFAAEAMIEAMPMLGRKLKGFDSDNTVMKAVETRSSSPVRILRDSQYEGSIRGIYPAGEGPGYAGGIMSAAVDGIRIAEMIINKKGE